MRAKDYIADKLVHLIYMEKETVKSAKEFHEPGCIETEFLTRIHKQVFLMLFRYCESNHIQEVWSVCSKNSASTFEINKSYNDFRRTNQYIIEDTMNKKWVPTDLRQLLRDEVLPLYERAHKICESYPATSNEIA